MSESLVVLPAGTLMGKYTVTVKSDSGVMVFESILEATHYIASNVLKGGHQNFSIEMTENESI